MENEVLCIFPCLTVDSVSHLGYRVQRSISEGSVYSTTEPAGPSLTLVKAQGWEGWLGAHAGGHAVAKRVTQMLSRENT